LTGLVKEIDKLAKADKVNGAVLVHFSDAKEEATKKLKELAEKNKLEELALTINQSGSKAPGSLKLNDKVKHTVLVYEGKKVKHNFALDKISEASVKEIVEKSKKVLKEGPKKALEAASDAKGKAKAEVKAKTDAKVEARSKAKTDAKVKTEPKAKEKSGK
jgi:hypothetical protein